MSKKPSKISEHITEHPALWAAIFLAVWAAVTNAMFLITNYVLLDAFMLFLCFMLVYPAGSLIMCFVYSKRCGIRWYMPFAMIPLVTIEYIISENFRAIQPNIFVTTGFAMLFGSGIGNIFADKDRLARQKKQRQDKRLHEDKKYRKILDD